MLQSRFTAHSPILYTYVRMQCTPPIKLETNIRIEMHRDCVSVCVRQRQRGLKLISRVVEPHRQNTSNSICVHTLSIFILLPTLSLSLSLFTSVSPLHHTKPLTVDFLRMSRWICSMRVAECVHICVSLPRHGIFLHFSYSFRSLVDMQ